MYFDVICIAKRVKIQQNNDSIQFEAKCQSPRSKPTSAKERGTTCAKKATALQALRNRGSQSVTDELVWAKLGIRIHSSFFHQLLAWLFNAFHGFCMLFIAFLIVSVPNKQGVNKDWWTHCLVSDGSVKSKSHQKSTHTPTHTQSTSRNIMKHHQAPPIIKNSCPFQNLNRV
jgi:hypothetical protein